MVLRRQLRFTNTLIPHRSGQQLRPGREWLGRGLVSRFDSASVLRLVGESSRATDIEAERWDLLRFAFELWSGAREKPTNALGQARMLLPVRSGWVPANDTILGRGWGEPRVSPANSSKPSLTAAPDCPRRSTR